jgi:hypothetical protein
MNETNSAVIARLDRATQYSRDSRVQSRYRSILDRPVRPGDDSLVVAGGLRAMTKRNFDSNFKQQTHVHILAAGCARGLRVVVPRKQREQGMPDARCTRGPVCKMGKEKRTRAYRFSGGTPAFPAQWLYGLLRALPGESGFVVSVVCE